MPNRNEQLQAHLRQLTSHFKLHLETELQALQEMATQLSTDFAIDEPRLVELRNRLHKIAGAAGTFGFTRLGSLARELEQDILAHLAKHALSTAEQQALIAKLQFLPDHLGPKATAPPDSQLKQPDHQPRASKKRLFLLTANPGLSHDICHTLDSFGYQCLGFSTFNILRIGLEQSLPDALIIDFSLLDSAAQGYLNDLQSRLKEQLPLIALANDNSFTQQLRAVRVGAQGFFTQPVDLPALENRLEGCFNQRHSEPFRVLIIDDDLALAARFEAVLSSSGMLAEVLDAPTALLDVMTRFTPDVVLMDVNMPEYSGPELAQLIRLNDDWLRIPIIYLSAETDTRVQMAALIKAGDDFITKPISDSDLLNAVYSRSQRARRMSQALARDSLTGLLKHADIKEQLAIEIERAIRNRQPVSVAMIDIDLFKSVNDVHGHAMGDNVIRALANLLRQRLRLIDRLGRYGGEEFVAVLPACNAEQAKKLLDEIRRDFNLLQFNSVNGTFTCSFSAGISACDAPDWGKDWVLELADKNLYRAKEQGRNCIVDYLE